MIKKFEEYISEGLWKQGVERSKSSEPRIEEIADLNLDEIKETDFFLNGKPLADQDVASKVTKNRLFDSQELKKILRVMNRSGWRLPTCDEMKTLLGEGNKVDGGKYEMHFSTFSTGAGELSIADGDLFENPSCDWYITWDKRNDFPITYWLEDGEVTVGKITRKDLPWTEPWTKATTITLNISKKTTNEPKRIRLIKDDSIVNEGLWKSGIERAKNNTDRLEESHTTNVKELKEIDLGSDVPFYIADQDTIIDDESAWLYDNIDEYEHYIKKFGWRLPYRDEILDYITTSLGNQINKERYFVSTTSKGYKKYSDLSITSRETKQKVEFVGQKKDYLNRMYYWLRVRDDDEQMAQLSIRPLDSKPSEAVTTELCPKSGNVYRRIRLVKDK